MREFEYFLFENFDADEEANNPYNPRSFLGKENDVLLTEIASNPIVAYDDCCDRFGEHLIRKLVDGGILRSDGASLAFNCPIFLREDAAVLHTDIATRAKELVDLLEHNLTEIRVCCANIQNGFPSKLNLYHILCGMVFDGYFFDYLGEKGVVATSRQHPSGLDYLTVIYEKCGELDALSNGLLCSYNRLVNDKCSLQSFGDADGDRFDFYRFFRLVEQKKIPGKFKGVAELFQSFGGTDKDALLAEVVSLIRAGECDPTAMALLERFGYVVDGKTCVPVYMPEHRSVIMEIERIVERSLGEAMSDVLLDLAGTIDITAVRYGVNRLEIANELYHIVFGSINEELVSRGIVAAPQRISGEGRYFECIEIYI